MDTEFDRTDDDAEQDDDVNSEESQSAHNVHSAEVNVDAFWQNPFALSMVSSNTVALRDVRPESIDGSIEQEADGEEDGEPIGGDEAAVTGATTAPNKRRKYGSHLCPVCSRSFGQKMVMYEHLNLHYGIRPHFCAVCGIRFASCSNLIKHRQLHRKHFTCVLCGDHSITFNTFGDVQNHVLATHPEVFAYQCTVCHSKFETQGLLADHVIMHPPLVLETRLEGKGKRKRNKPLVQLSSPKRAGPLLRSRLRSGTQTGTQHKRTSAKTAPSQVKNGQDITCNSGNGNTLPPAGKLPRATPPHNASVSRLPNGDSCPSAVGKSEETMNGTCLSPRLDAQANSNSAAASSNHQEMPNGDRPTERASPISQDENRLFETLLQRRILNGELFRCSTCEILFFDRAMFSVHRCTHEENNPLRCAMCRTLCSDRYEFALHCVKPKQQDILKLD